MTLLKAIDLAYYMAKDIMLVIIFVKVVLFM